MIGTCSTIKRKDKCVGQHFFIISRLASINYMIDMSELKCLNSLSIRSHLSASPSPKPTEYKTSRKLDDTDTFSTVVESIAYSVDIHDSTDTFSTVDDSMYDCM